MIKLVVTIVLMLVSNVFFAQSDFDKYEGQDGVTPVIVNKKMFQMMASVKVDANDKETQQYLNLMKKLDNLKVFKTFSPKIASDMRLTASNYVKKMGLKEMMQQNKATKKIKIWANSEATDAQVKELLILVEDENNTAETVLLSLTGDFSLSELAILTDKMKIPDVGNLKKTLKGS